MTTAQNPENQNPNGLHDLGQISKENARECNLVHCETHKKGNYETKHNPNPWVIVEYAGQDDESIRADFANYRDATRAIKNWYYPDELKNLGVQIMRRRDDGILTTEF